MRFSLFCLLPLALATALPASIHDERALDARSPNADALDERTLWGNKCDDWLLKKIACKKQGWGYEFDKDKCECVGPSCHPDVKKNCDNKGSRYRYNAHECKCEGPFCPADEKKDCEKKGNRFKYNDHECKCEGPFCPAEEKKDCEKKGNRFKYNDHECKCEGPFCPAEVKKDCDNKGWRYKYNDHECRCDEVCPSHAEYDCQKTYGTFDKNTCKCTPKPPSCDANHKKSCLAKWGATYDDHKCVCNEPPKQDCSLKAKLACITKWGSTWDHAKCVCIDKKWV